MIDAPENGQVLAGKHPLKMWSQRLDERLKDLGLTQRVLDWDAPTPQDKMISAGAFVLITGIIKETRVGAYAVVVHDTQFKDPAFQDIVYNNVLLDAKAKGVVHHDKT